MASANSLSTVGSSSEHPNKRLRSLELAVCIFLILSSLGVFWQLQNHDFVTFDDTLYVTKNRHVQAGLSVEGIAWAFSTTHASNWHPVTWLSHMLDCEIYGLDPGRHHLTSLLLHIANSILLFLVLRRPTGKIWPSSFVAALFALHPLHVESIAWVAERKDVLSTLFWMLTMWSYFHYVEAPGLGRYLLVFFSFALGLMTKPMLVTMPFVLLLMDYWPLARFRPSEAADTSEAVAKQQVYLRYQSSLIARLVWEKIPLFAMAVVSSVVTFGVQKSGGAVEPLSTLPLGIRLANVPVSYLKYMGKMLWPHNLTVFYPHPGALPIWYVVGAGLLVVSITILVIRAAGRYPYLAVGWLWYVGTLVPVIGLVQVGSQAIADRYTYVPLIGLFIMIAWGIPNLVTRLRRRRVVLAIFAGATLISLMVGSYSQARFWKDSVELFKHCVSVTPDHELVHNNLGVALEEQGHFDEAIRHYSEALRIQPHHVRALYNLGLNFARQGRLDEAVSYYLKALSIRPDYVEAHCQLGIALGLQGRLDEAIMHFSKALRIRPDYAEAWYNMGVSLNEQGKPAEAVAHFSEALRIKPDYVDAYNDLGIVLARQGRLDEAITHFSKAVTINPGHSKARNNLRRALNLRQNPK